MEIAREKERMEERERERERKKKNADREKLVLRRRPLEGNMDCFTAICLALSNDNDTDNVPLSGWESSQLGCSDRSTVFRYFCCYDWMHISIVIYN